MDEPTNHLDITSKEILENALVNYTGTVLYVSHDRYFINSTATRILELSCQTITNYIGDYDYYMEKRDILSPKTEPVLDSKAAENTSKDNSKANWQLSREQQAALRRKKNELKKTEVRIDEVENRISEIDELYIQPDIATDIARLLELHKERETLEEEQENLYEKWSNLSEECQI